MDEASQIPLAVWPMILNNAGEKKIVVAGDPLQLEPVSAKLKDVNAQYWFSQNLYSYLGMTTMKGIAPFRSVGLMTLLNEQSRMRKDICKIVSTMFYDGLLIGDRKDGKMEAFQLTSLKPRTDSYPQRQALRQRPSINHHYAAFLCSNIYVIQAGAYLALFGVIKEIYKLFFSIILLV